MKHDEAYGLVLTLLHRTGAEACLVYFCWFIG